MTTSTGLGSGNRRNAILIGLTASLKGCRPQSLLLGDLKFRAPGAPLYFGGGLNVLTGDDNSDTGFNLLGGFETRYGQTHPYIEGRVLSHDSSAFQLVFGLNITLY